VLLHKHEVYRSAAAARDCLYANKEIKVVFHLQPHSQALVKNPLEFCRAPGNEAISHAVHYLVSCGQTLFGTWP